jgi:hypothetical protein
MLESGGMKLAVFVLAFCFAAPFDSIAAVKPKKSAKLVPEAPLVLYPACPCFHLIGSGTGETKIDVLINYPETLRFGWQLEVKLRRSDGAEVQTVTCDASKAGSAEVKLHVPIQSAASFKVYARLLNASGKESAGAETDIRVIPPGPARVTLGPDGFLREDGKSVFVIGMYNGGRFGEMAAAGFNATHNYGITVGDAADVINPSDARLKHALDTSWSNGLRMMVELPRRAVEKGQWGQVSRRIETFRHHPGLLCWGSEERVARGLTSLTAIASLYRLVHELDPDHPLVLGDTKDKIQKFKTDRRDFFPDPYMDAGIWWWYPIPLKDPDGNGLAEGQEKKAAMLTPPSWLTTTVSKKPLWIAIQSYQHPSRDARFPTPAEYRCMAYLSIINGVKGLWFYTGSGQRDFEGKPAGILNKPEEGHWAYVRTLTQELRGFSPVIMADPVKEKIEMNPPNAPVEFTTRELEGTKYLIAANKSSEPQSVTFSSDLFKGKHPKILFENEQKPETTNGVSRVSFVPFGVHVIRIE